MPVLNSSLPSPATSVVTSVTVTAVSTVLLTANVDRRQFVIYNDSGGIVFVAFAATAAVTTFSVRLSDNTFYESPLNGYIGIVSAIRSGGSGPVRVTDIRN